MKVLRADGKFVAFDDGTTWPTPMDEADGGLEYRLRHAHPDQLIKDRFLAASIVSAYRELLACPRRRRDSVISQLRRAITSSGARP